MSSILPLSEALPEAAVGTKAYTLALLLQSHYPVPKGFIITAQAFQPCIQHHTPYDEWIFAESLRSEIVQAYHAFVTPPVIIRSSGATEDSSTASFAGQYETILHATADNLFESIQRCWLSASREHARTYIEQRYPAGERTPTMSVIVQELVASDRSGVIFSKNPMTGNEDEVVINSSYGLGDAVVSGLVTPDLYILSKRRNSILTKELGDKTRKWIVGRFETNEVETTLQEQSEYSLQDEQLIELLALTKSIESLLGYSVDLEFAYRDGKLYILQARRIST